jgi:hypothetical protein
MTLAPGKYLYWTNPVAFGQFPHIASKQLGADTFEDRENEQEHQQLLELFRVDNDRLRASTATVSYPRYHIRAARLVRFKAQYDFC